MGGCHHKVGVSVYLAIRVGNMAHVIADMIIIDSRSNK